MECSKDKAINVKISKTAIRINERANVCLEISEDIGFIDKANIFISMQHNENEKQIEFKYLWTEKGINYFTCNIDLKYAGLYYFGINIVVNGEEKWLGMDYESQTLFLCNEMNKPWTITAYYKEFEVPEWAKGKVMYHIFVDRFFKSKKYNPIQMENRITKKWGEMPEWKDDSAQKYNNIDFFMGNLEGIQEKIPYLKSLGVKILYLSPIFKSQSNHRYDVGDYEQVDPYLGKNEDLKKLCVKAHRNGIRVIIDAVFNHTGNDSKYFNEYGNYSTIGAFQGKNSQYYDWYKHGENGEFEYWWGFKNLPVCNGKNEGWQNYVYGKNGIIDKWFNLGIDGLRLDVADELDDEFIQNIRKAVKRNKKDGFIIGEVWENAITKEKDGRYREYLLGDGLDSVMNYPYTNAILKYVRFGDYNYLINTVNEILTKYPKESVDSLMNSLSTHDITRAITTLISNGINEKNALIWDSEFDRDWQVMNDKLSENEYEIGEKMFKIATLIQYFLPGNACIYYGDEVGMYGYRDPFNRKCFDWNLVGNKLNEFFKTIGKIKNEYVMLQEANFRFDFVNEEILCFERFNSIGALMVIVNRSNKPINIGIKEHINGKIILQEKLFDNKLGEYGYAIIWTGK